MATYKVKAYQNIFDVAIHLYGSIEGLFDLLISNSWLNMTTELKAGMELEYHDYWVLNDGIRQEIKDQGYLPANGERHVYYKRPDTPLVFVCGIEPDAHSSSFTASGSGIMLIDWGDNSEIEEVRLAVEEQTVTHYFDNTVDERRIKVYGDFQLMTFNITGLGGAILLTRPMTVDEFVCHSTGYTLKGLFLFDGTVTVDLQRCHIDDLLPIGDMSLQTLDLRGVTFKSVNVIDEYLQYIADNYGSRRNCTVYLTDKPTEKGMAAIEKILAEDSWNEAGNWVFDINGTIYTRQ